MKFPLDFRSVLILGLWLTFVGCSYSPKTVYSIPDVEKRLRKFQKGTSLAEVIEAVGAPLLAVLVAQDDATAKTMPTGRNTLISPSKDSLLSLSVSGNFTLVLSFSRRAVEGVAYERVQAEFRDGRLVDVESNVDLSDLFGP